MILNDRTPADQVDPEQVDLVPDQDRSETSAAENPNDIRAEMVQTRAEMSATIDAIQERLDPEHLKRQATETIRDATEDLKRHATEAAREATIGKAEHFMNTVEDTAREKGSGLAEIIRQNPIPAALVGVGLAWMFFNGSERNTPARRSSRGNNNYYWSDGREEYGGRGVPSTMARTSTGTNVGAQVRETGQKLGDQVQDTVGQVQDTVHQFGNRAQDQFSDIRDDVQDQVQSVSSDVQRQADWLNRNVERVFHETPLAVGAVVLALGAAVGLAAPSTAQEDQLMGEARGQFLEKANDAAHDALDQVQKVADKVQATQTESSPGGNGATKIQTAGASGSGDYAR